MDHSRLMSSSLKNYDVTRLSSSMVMPLLYAHVLASSMIPLMGIRTEKYHRWVNIDFMLQRCLVR